MIMHIIAFHLVIANLLPDHEFIFIKSLVPYEMDLFASLPFKWVFYYNKFCLSINFMFSTSIYSALCSS